MPNKHPYAELIIEWLKDTSQKIEGKNLSLGGMEWKDVQIDDVLNCTHLSKWEFHLQAEDKCCEITSSLTDDELRGLSHRTGNILQSFRAIANAAAQRVMDDLKTQGVNTELLDSYFNILTNKK